MTWRGLIIIFTHTAIALLVWAGYSYVYEGLGLHPLIAFPAALALYFLHLLWIEAMCTQYECDAPELLETIENIDPQERCNWT